MNGVPVWLFCPKPCKLSFVASYPQQCHDGIIHLSFKCRKNSKRAEVRIGQILENHFLEMI